MRTAQVVLMSLTVSLVVAFCTMHGSVAGKAESATPLKVGVVNLER